MKLIFCVNLFVGWLAIRGLVHVWACLYVCPTLKRGQDTLLSQRFGLPPEVHVGGPVKCQGSVTINAGR